MNMAIPASSSSMQSNGETNSAIKLLKNPDFTKIAEQFT